MKLNSLLAGAILTGLIAGNIARADDAATGESAEAHKGKHHHCKKGDKECKEHKKDKMAAAGKKDKDGCGGKDGCSGDEEGSKE